MGLRCPFIHGILRNSERCSLHRDLSRPASPIKFTVTQIQSEKNAEVRRVMIERFGQSRFLLESGAKEIHRDDFGILYQQEVEDDEPLVMVKVVNATPEPDGSFRDYFLRVAPDLKPMPNPNWTAERQDKWKAAQKPQMLTARNAVASTWGRRGENYAPVLET